MTSKVKGGHLFRDGGVCDKYAKSEFDGLFPLEITSLIGTKYAFKVVIEDYNAKKLLHVFNVLRLSNDSDIINSIIPFVAPVSPDEKEKTNKRKAEGEPGSESTNVKKKALKVKIEKDP
ncbi:hypothetical protein Tco_0215560 [Tanacetum coccineum]